MAARHRATPWDRSHDPTSSGSTPFLPRCKALPVHPRLTTYWALSWSA